MSSKYVPNIVVDDINLGGISESIYQGGRNSVASLVGFDVHSVPGRLKVNQKFSKLEGDVIDELVLAMVACSDGNTYAFGSMRGKVWKIDSGDHVTFITQLNAGVLDAQEYFGYIYFAMKGSSLGRWKVGNPWALREDTFAVFQNGDTEFHPMIEQNRVLYIGDGYLVAQVDASDPEGGNIAVYSADALDIPPEWKVTALGKQNTRLLIGSKPLSGENKARLFNWDTWSISWDVEDYVDELGINAFIPSHDIVLVSVGTHGNLYSYNGSQLVPMKQVQCGGLPAFSPSNSAKIYNNAVGNVGGVPYFGFSNLANNPTLQGVYSFGHRDSSYPRILALECPISTGNFDNITIGSICVVKNNIYVSWKDENGKSPVYGIDKRDYTAKYPNAYFETRAMKGMRNYDDSYKKFIMEYDILPEGTNVTIGVRKNNSDYMPLTPIIDEEHDHIYAEDDVKPMKLQVRIGAVVNGNDAPELTGLVIPLVILYGKMRYQ